MHDKETGHCGHCTKWAFRSPSGIEQREMIEESVIMEGAKTEVVEAVHIAHMGLGTKESS